MLFCKHKKLCTVLISSVRRLVSLKEIGKLLECRKDGKYYSGELFLHKKFDYRGIILFPWKATVYDGDKTLSCRLPSVTSQTYYQTLVDLRDWEYVRAQKVNDDITLLQDHELTDSRLLKIPGLDYVGHGDIQPYTSKEEMPIIHTLFDEFFDCHVQQSGTLCIPTKRLQQFQTSGHPWLTLSKVYRERTRNMQVTVIPFYLGEKRNRGGVLADTSEGVCRSGAVSSWWWRYCVRVENWGEEPVRLRGSQWKLFSEQASPPLENYVKMKVVGKEPKLCPSKPTFQFSSHVALQTPSGSMWGCFQVEMEDGETFECKIPVFNLEVMPAPQDEDDGDAQP